MSYLDVRAYEAVGPCGRLRLTPLQYSLLLSLSRVKPGTVVSYEQLTLAIYGSDNVHMWRQALDRLTQRTRLVLRQVGHADLIHVREGVGLFIRADYETSRACDYVTG